MEILERLRDFTFGAMVLRYCKDSRMSIVNLKIHTLEGKDTLYAAEVKVRGNTQPEPLTEHISHMNGIVSVAAL